MFEMTSLTRNAPNTTIAEFPNIVDPDEMAQNELSHLDLQCLPSSPKSFHMIQFELKVFENFADVILSSAFLPLYELKCVVIKKLALFPTST